MSTITESEKKRLQSLKEKKQAFKTKGQFLQQALRNLDNTTKHNKIIFDDIDEQQSPKSKRKKRDLFDSDNDDDNEKDSPWNKDEFTIEENKPKKTILGNDARFTLDDRFVKNDDQTELDGKTKLVEDINECDLQKEKEKQLDILESILGAPLTVKNQETKTAKKKLMIRYDPTENGHGEYEVKSEQPKIKEKNTKKKRDKFVSEIEPIPPEPEVSKDIYYAVSDILTESLKQKGEFSLLKKHRKDDAGNAEDCTAIMENNKAQKFKLNFNATNAFKYDSSDTDEDLNEVLDTDKQMTDEVEKNTNNLFEYKDTLFLDNKDVRFNEATRFFNAESTSNDEFKNLRRELKMIVRTKIRTNERKHQPWNKKRKIKKFKK